MDRPRSRTFWVGLAVALVLLCVVAAVALWGLAATSTAPTAAGPRTPAASASATRSSPAPVRTWTTRSTGSTTGGVTYTVQPDGTLAPEPTVEHEVPWGDVLALLGRERVVARIVSVEFYDDPKDDSQAAVWRTADDPQRWHMVINEDGLDDHAAMTATYIHEFAHTLTLSGDQVSEVSGSCPRLELDEGCALPDSYIDAFEQEFWADYGPDAPTIDASAKEVEAFYRAHRGDFLTSYAATNVTEDLAETFTGWVLGDPRATRSPVVKDKVALLAAFPELVTLRAQIRDAVDPAVLGRPIDGE